MLVQCWTIVFVYCQGENNFTSNINTIHRPNGGSMLDQRRENYFHIDSTVDDNTISTVFIVRSFVWIHVSFTTAMIYMHTCIFKLRQGHNNWEIPLPLQKEKIFFYNYGSIVLFGTYCIDPYTVVLVQHNVTWYHNMHFRVLTDFKVR